MPCSCLFWVWLCCVGVGVLVCAAGFVWIMILLFVGYGVRLGSVGWLGFVLWFDRWWLSL